MKKITGIIVLIILIILIGFGFTYKMVEPDGWDRVVDKVVEQVPALENIISESTPTPIPTATPQLTPTPTVSPSASPSVTPSETPSTTPDDSKTEYEKYIELSGEEQQKIFESYSNPQDFFDWYNAAKKEYDDENQAIIVEGGSINLEDYIDKDE